jgi:hypothetical protein
MDPQIKSSSRVEASYKISTVALQVVEGEEKGVRYLVVSLDHHITGGA